MIINWFSTHPDPGDLSERLRTAYALWLSSCGPGSLPMLKRVEASPLYGELSDYVALIEDRGEGDDPRLFFATAGPKVVELFGKDPARRPFDEILTESGQSLSLEIHEVLRAEARPVHFSISGSPAIGRDIEAIVMPLRRDEGEGELDLLVYDF